MANLTGRQTFEIRCLTTGWGWDRTLTNAYCWWHNAWSPDPKVSYDCSKHLYDNKLVNRTKRLKLEQNL